MEEEEALGLLLYNNQSLHDKIHTLQYLEYNNINFSHVRLQFSFKYNGESLWTHFYMKYTILPMYWYNMDLGIEYPIWMDPKTMDGGGRDPCLD